MSPRKFLFRGPGAFFLAKILCAVISSAIYFSAPSPARGADEPAAAKEAPKDGAAAPQASPTPALAPGTDYICEADLFFVWQPTPPKDRNSKKDPESSRGTSQDPIRDFFTTVGEQGVVEEEVRNRLQNKIPQVELQAMEACKTIHQDLTLCVAARMRTAEEQYTKLDFVARRAMAEAVGKACEMKLGKCQNTESSEIRCHLNRPPEIPPHEPEEDAAAAKDGKKEPAKKK